MIWLSIVVLPLPKKPVSNVTGINIVGVLGVSVIMDYLGGVHLAANLVGCRRRILLSLHHFPDSQFAVSTRCGQAFAVSDWRPGEALHTIWQLHARCR